MDIPAMLALTIDPDWLVYGVVGVIVVISWVTNVLKQYQHPKSGKSIEQMVLEQRVRQMTRKGKSGQARGAGSPQSDLDALAAKRRRQLQEMARQKRGGGSSSGSTPTRKQTGQITRSQQLQRARARAQSQAQSPSRPSQRATQPSTARSTHRTQSTARSSAQQRRSGRPQQRTIQRQSKQLQRQAAARKAPKPQQPQQPQVVVEEEESVVRQKVQDTVVAPPSVGLLNTKRGLSLQKISLREAVVLKEILDRPLALRNPLD